MPRLWISCTYLLLSAACSTPGPSPDERAARQLPAPPAADAERGQVLAACRQARLALLRGELDTAEAAAKALLSRHPWSGRARAIRARVLATRAAEQQPPDLAGLDEAEGELLLARKAAPADPEIRVDLAWFLARRGLVAAAAAELDALLETQPRHLEGLRMAGRLHFELGRERRSLILAERLLELEPGNVTAGWQRAWSALRIAESLADGDVPEPAAAGARLREAWTRAEAAFIAYRKLAPDDLAGFLGGAMAAAQLAGTLEDDTAKALALSRAVELLRDAAAAHPEAPGPHHSLAVIEEGRADLAAARTAYRAALARQRDYLPSLYNLSLLAAAQGDQALLAEFRARALLHPKLSAAQRGRLQGLKSP